MSGAQDPDVMEASMQRRTIRTVILATCGLVMVAARAQGQCANPPGNVVFEWTNLLLAVSGPGTSTTSARNQGNQIVSRSMAMMHGAIYDSVNAIDGGHSMYRVDARSLALPEDSAEAAAAQAAHDVAVGLYTRAAEVALFNATLSGDLCAIPDGPAKNDGVAIGHYVASQILAWRANDGSSNVVPYAIGSTPGDWQPTPPAFAGTPATPQWPYVTPFALTTGSQFRPGPPPALASSDYTEAFQQLLILGGNGTTTPSSRTPEQTEIAIFWAGVGVTNAGIVIWNQIAESVSAGQGLTLVQNARLFALLNVSIADAFIAGFDAKYAFNNGHGFWRPVTAIRAADTDGNVDTIQDPTWTPLVTTPNHPSYVALHAAQSYAAAVALASFFGTDHVAFTATWGGVERAFNKFTAAAHEAGMSRIYGGIHWSFDVAAGWHVGRDVGQYVGANFFLPSTSKENSPGRR
jgi:hypothetical protein